VSVASDGTQGNYNSLGGAVSDDGRFVAFQSSATNLVADDTNNCRDVFVRDRATGSTELVSIRPDGGQFVDFSGDNSAGADPDISADGRFVVFESVVGRGIYVRDRLTGTTELVSVNSDGQSGNGRSYQPAISANGRFVVFTSKATNFVAGDTNNLQDVYLHDRRTGITERISIGPGGKQASRPSFQPVVTNDGRFVAFYSAAKQLVANDTNDSDDVFVRDRTAGVTERVSVASDGSQIAYSGYPAISGAGRFVTFASGATNVVPGDPYSVGGVYVRDRLNGTTKRISADPRGGMSSITPDGRFVAFEGSAPNGMLGVFLYDRWTRSTKLASVGVNGELGDAASGDSDGDPWVFAPTVSADGRFVAFQSYATNLVPADTNNRPDVFVRDLQD
jgi:Tol biopolymer transport system component